MKRIMTTFLGFILGMIVGGFVGLLISLGLSLAGFFLFSFGDVMDAIVVFNAIAWIMFGGLLGGVIGAILAIIRKWPKN